jgi:hypothetical protein
VFGIASPFRKVNLCVGQNQLNLIVGGKKSTRQTQRQEESLRQVFLIFLRNAEFQNRFFSNTSIPKKPTKNNSIPEDIEQFLSGKCFQFRNGIGRFSEFRTPNHSSGKISNPIPQHHPKNPFS